INAVVNNNSPFQQGNTPLFFAVAHQREQVVIKLISANAELNKTNNKNKITPLYRATLRGYINIVAHLIKAGADINIADNEGFSPLLIAIQHKHLTIATLLIDAKANVNAENK